VFQLRELNRPGDLGWVIKAHGELYAREYGLDHTFEGYVAAGLGEFAKAFDGGKDRLWLAEADGRLVGCGGWSRRRTLFGGDRYAARESGLLDPATEPAKIRAFFVHPSWARRGVGRAILETCEREAKAHGFRALELMATLPGVRLYAAHGYRPGERVTHDAGGVPVEFVPMRKELG
jgi:GNAT superfamily N-acetyltransferase